MRKPDIVTSSDALLNYIFEQLINEQRRTNELLEQLVPKKEVKDVTPRNVPSRKQTS